MGIAPLSCRRLACLAGLASCLLPLTAFSQTPGIKTSRQVAAAPPSNPPATPTLTLADCLRIAHERQPAIQAYRASLAAAEDSRQGLPNLPRLTGLSSEGLP